MVSLSSYDRNHRAEQGEAEPTAERGGCARTFGQETASIAMKSSIAVALLLSLSVFAADSGEALAEPKTLVKVISAIESSGIDELTSKKDEQGTSYHLRRAILLGTVTRAGLTYTIAHAVFVRSSPPGRETPPPRGHDFIVVLDANYRILAHGRTGFGEYRMRGDRLYYDGIPDPCADFGTTSPGVRHGGYPEIGLPYPFPDRISDADWESGAFQNKP